MKQLVVSDSRQLEDAGVYAEFLGLFQTAQRVSEANGQNLSDAVFNVCELLERIEIFDHPLITTEIKTKAKDCIQFRFKKLYTPNLALAVMCDPRRSFAVDANLQRLLPKFSWREDSHNCLKTRLKVLPAEEQRLCLSAYADLVAGRFDFDEDAMDEADNLPLTEWYQQHREVGGEPLSMLSQRILERLYTLNPAQAGVERLNSLFKFIQACRQAMLAANSRKLTYLYVNRRVLEEYYGGKKPPPGSYALGKRWPARSESKLIAVLDDAIAEAVIAKEQVGVDVAIALMEADEQAEAEGAVAAPRARGAAGAGGAAAGGAAAGKAVAPKRKAAAPSKGKDSKRPKAARGAVGATEAAAKERAAQERAMTLIDMDDSDEEADSGASSGSESYSLRDDSDGEEPRRPPLPDEATVLCPRCCVLVLVEDLDEFGRCGRKPVGKTKCNLCMGCRRKGCPQGIDWEPTESE